MTRVIMIFTSYFTMAYAVPIASAILIMICVGNKA